MPTVISEEEELEAEVARRAAAGDVRAAAERALRGLGPQVLRFLRCLLRDEDLAGDAFSLFAEDLWRGLPAFRGDASLRTWAFRLARHVAVRVHGDRWRRRRVPLSRKPASRVAEAVRSQTPLEDERRSRVLESLREKLSFDDRSLLALRLDQGLSWAEVAQVFADGGRPVEVAALQKRFQRVKERLAVLAGEEGLLDSGTR